MTNQKNLQEEFNQAYQEANNGWQNFVDQANIDLRFYQNEQWTGKDIAYLKQQDREPLVFNRLKRVVKIVTGYERKNRTVLKIGPIGGEDDPACQQFNKIIPTVMNYDGYEVLSEAFKFGSLISGSNLVEFYPDFEDNINFARWAHTNFLLDPSLTKQDLSDCDYIILGKMATKDQVNLIVPDADQKAIDHLLEQDSSGGSKFPHLPHRDIKHGKPRFQLNFWWRRTTEQKKVLVDRATGKQTPWQGTVKQLKQLFANNPQIQQQIAVITRPVKSIKLDTFYGGTQIANTKIDPYKLGDYSFIWVPGDYAYESDNDKLKLQSLIRCARDPQIADNRRLMSMIDILESQAYGGDFFEEDALVDPEDAYKSGNGQPMIFKQNAITNKKFAQRVHKDIPAGMFQLQEVFNRYTFEIPGVNQELFGTEDKEIPGILNKLRQGAALTVLQESFDAFRFAKKLLGRKIVRFIQNNWSDGKINRIIKQPPAPGLREHDFTKYDCTVQEGLLTSSQREMAYAEMKSMKLEGKAPIPWAAIFEVAPIQMKDEIKKYVTQAEQQQGQIEKMQAQQQQILNFLNQSKAIENIEQSKTERSERAENIANAQLDRAKAMKEMAKMDTEEIKNLAETHKLLTEGRSENRKERRKGMSKR